ncbi:MAG: hypothetical protein HQK77_00780 [Desulfobacterales bacterium]|nr:hypothetical protein [Desulfobacterales bacterium]
MILEEIKDTIEFIKSDLCKQVEEVVNQSIHSIVRIPLEMNHLLLPLHIIQHALPSNSRCWYVSPEDRLSQFKTSVMLNHFKEGIVDVNTYWQIDGYQKTVVFWSTESLVDHLIEIESNDMQYPDFIVFDEMDIVTPEINSRMVELLLRINTRVHLFFCVSYERNINQVTHWIEQILKQPYQMILLNTTPNKFLPVLLGSWDLIPFIDKKRVALKAKRYLKENPDIIKVNDHKFRYELVDYLRKKNFTPCIVILNSSEDCDSWVKTASKKPTHHENVESILNHFKWKTGIEFDPSELTDLLNKKLGAIHSKLHYRWAELIEYLFFYNIIDVLFTTLNYSEHIHAHAKTIVICTTNREVVQNSNPDVMNSVDTYHIKRLATRHNTENINHIIALHTRDMDITHLKDMLVSPPSTFNYPLHVGFPFLLGLMSLLDKDPIEIVHDVFQWEPIDDETGTRLLAMFDEIKTELPEANCGSSLATLKLRDIMFRLQQQINDVENKIKHEQKNKFGRLYEQQLQELLNEIELLPCNSCPNYQICHRRSHRKLRNLFDEYFQLNRKIFKSFAFSQIEISDYVNCLRHVNAIDEKNQLTHFGRLSSRFSLTFPMLLATCIEQDMFKKQSDSSLNVAFAGSFSESDLSIPMGKYDDFVFQDIINGYDQIIDLITPMRRSIYKYGFVPNKPSLLFGMILMAWQSGMDIHYIVSRLNISEGAFINLFYKANYLYHRITTAL